jgi:hypothetical protein
VGRGEVPRILTDIGSRYVPISDGLLVPLSEVSTLKIVMIL